MSKETRAMAVINRDDTTFQKIMAHQTNPDAFPLTTKESEILERWRRIFTMQLRHNSKMRIVNVLVNEGLSMSQAYADIKNVESLFGSTMKADKEFQRVLWLEHAQDLLMRAKQSKNMIMEGKALDMIAKYSGFNDKDDAQFNAEKLEHFEIQFAIDSVSEQKLKEMNTKGRTNVVDFNSFNVVDIDHEDIAEDEKD